MTTLPLVAPASEDERNAHATSGSQHRRSHITLTVTLARFLCIAFFLTDCVLPTDFRGKERLLAVYKNSDQHSHPFYMGVSPGVHFEFLWRHVCTDKSVVVCGNEDKYIQRLVGMTIYFCVVVVVCQDRVLYRSRDPSSIQPVIYSSCVSVKISDHR